MKQQTINKIFSPIELGNTTLSSRIAMAPMTRSRAIGNVANELIANYYQQRSTAGLIITEGVAPSPNGLGYSRIPGIYSGEQVSSWKATTEAVHTQGAKIFMQLMHTGRISHIANMPPGSRVLAPSAIAAKGDMWTDTEGMQPFTAPEEMTAADIEAAIEEFVKAAGNAIEAGFDGIELHGANGYLLEQFLNPNANTRTDNYGGSVTNRIRFVLEVATRVANKIGKEKTAIRLSPFNAYNDMPLYDETHETYLALAQELEKIGVAYIHIIDVHARTLNSSLIKDIRNSYSGILILNGGYTIDTAGEALENGLADIIAFGAPFIANPDLPHRLKNNIDLAQPDPASFFSAGAEGFTDYPFAEKVAQETA
jgi:N-ethylmaleimide reductase